MRITIEHDPETNQWCSYCDNPGVASCGDTPALALEAVLEAADLYRATVAQIEAEGGTVASFGGERRTLSARTQSPRPGALGTFDPAAWPG